MRKIILIAAVKEGDPKPVQNYMMYTTPDGYSAFKMSDETVRRYYAATKEQREAADATLRREYHQKP